MTRTTFWVRIAVGTVGAAVLFALVPRHPGGWPLPVALAAGAAAGATLFAAVERRPPPLPRPAPPPVPLWLAKHGFLALWAWVEEVAWRLGALGALVRVVPAALALAAVSVAFALWHRPARPEHLAAGLLFGGLFLGSGSLAAAWAAHVAYNGSVATAGKALARPETRRRA